MDLVALQSGNKGIISEMVRKVFSEVNDVLWVYDLESSQFILSEKMHSFYGLDFSKKIDTIDEFFEKVFPRDRKQLEKIFLKTIKRETEDFSTDIRFACSDGSFKKFKMTGKLVEITDSEGTTEAVIAGSMTNLDEKRKDELRINYISYHDSITGLPNRMMFNYKTNSTISQKEKMQSKMAVISVELNGMDIINNLYGHSVGDSAIKAAAEYLTEKLSSSDLLAKPEGDAFLVLTSIEGGRSKFEDKTRELLEGLNRDVRIENIEISLSGCAGIAIYPEDGKNAEELVKNAEAAMKKAKEQGKNEYCFFDKNVYAQIERKSELEKNLKKALDNDELYLVYQPQIDVATGELAGVEVLLRWESSVHGNVPPMEFINVAEDSGMILPIGLWVLKQACMQCKQWENELGIKLPVAVNISAVQLKHEGFCRSLTSILEEIHFLPELLELEITESTLMENFQQSSIKLDYLRKNGIRIALDDFGTGYSSLNYLKRLPLDTLKIDKSFIDDLMENQTEKEIASTIVNLSHHLKLTVVAEGVETADQLDCLKAMGCNVVQGYYFSKPVKSGLLEEKWFGQGKTLK